MTATATQATPNTQRDPSGRFRTGNTGGPGNPFARQVSLLRKALIACVTAEQIQAIAQAMVAKAIEGNVQAAKLVYSYILGKPDTAPNPDRMDMDEWEGYRETAEMQPEAAKLASAGESEYHLQQVRILRPLVTDFKRCEMDQMLKETAPDLFGQPAAPPPEPEPEPEPEEEGENEYLDSELYRSMSEYIQQHDIPPSSNGKKSATPKANGNTKQREPSANGHFKRPTP